MYMWIYTYIHTYIFMCVYIWLCACKHMHICVHIYTYVCVHIYIYVCVYAYVLEKETATHCSILENSMDRGAWWTTVHGVTKSRPQLHTCICVHTWMCVCMCIRGWGRSISILRMHPQRKLSLYPTCLLSPEGWLKRLPPNQHSRPAPWRLFVEMS